MRIVKTAVAYGVAAATAALFALAACTADDQAKADAAIAKAKVEAVQVCAQDAKLQPVVATDVAALAALGMLAGPQGAALSAAVSGGVAVDAAAIHPLVVEACASLSK